MMAEGVKKKARLNQKIQEKTAKLRKQPSILSFSVKRGLMDPRKQKKMEEDLVKMTIMMNRPFFRCRESLLPEVNPQRRTQLHLS